MDKERELESHSDKIGKNAFEQNSARYHGT